MKRLLFAFSLCLCCNPGFAQVKTQPLSSAPDPAAGLTYSLPKTVFVIEVETKRTQETPGIYFPYAERYLGLTNVCRTEAVKYEIVGVKVRMKALPDLQNAYLITSGKSKIPAAIQLSPEGFLQAIGKSVEPKPVASLEKKTATACIKDNYQTKETSVVTQEMQQASSTAKMAELAANQLFNLRESRINLLTQDLDKLPADGRSYEIILSELNRMEKYYTELFTGKRVKSTEKVSFEFEPQKNGEEILFRFSQLKGVVDKTNLGGDPVFIQLQKVVGTMADLSKTPAFNPKKEYSVYYRVPAKAQVKITDGIKVFCNETLPVAQFGRVLNLPLNAFQSAEFCPMTGAILSVE